MGTTVASQTLPVVVPSSCERRTAHPSPGRTAGDGSESAEGGRHDCSWHSLDLNGSARRSPDSNALVSRPSTAAPPPTVRDTPRARPRSPRVTEVRRDPLDVEERHAGPVQQLDERHERHLRRVPPVVEHRLPGEEAADASPRTGHRPAHRSSVHDLDAVRPAELVEPAVGGDERRRDPAPAAGGSGARRHHIGERGVDPDLVAARARRNERLTGSPSRGSMPRGSGDHQPSRRRSYGMGNRPAR